ncbi:FliO/MopB family protein [Pyxidicoccus fallax]|uniref:FliO/MopB family protein n=3 Tax=Pyxidicoccus fallax TaxID=394095 RepID=A0A848LUB1_9BACT|nr:FliO/MopB family protein [Pyxidicoccus fallax]
MRLFLGAALVLTPPAVLAQAPSAPAEAPPTQAAPAAAPVNAASTAATPVEAPAPVVTPPSEVAAPAKAEAASPRAAADGPSRGAEGKWDDPTLDETAGAPEEQESLGWTLVRTLLVLGAVVASIYLTLNVGLRRLMGLQAVSAGRQPLVSVVERLPLDQRRSLFVVKAAGEYLLVGGGEAGLQLLSKLDTEAVERLRAQRPETNVVPLSPFLQKLLSRRSGGSPSQPPGA